MNFPVAPLHGVRRQDGGDEPSVPPRLNMKGVRAFAWTAFWLLNAIYITACIQRTAIPGAVFNNLQGDFGLDASQVTWVSSIYTYIYGSAKILTGIAVDRFGGKKMGLTGGFFIAAGLLLLCFAKTPEQLYLSRGLTAFGNSFMYISIVKICHLLFSPREYGGMISLSIAIGFLGTVLGTLPIRLCISWTTGAGRFGWRASFLVLGLLCLALSVCSTFLLRVLKERPRKSSVVTWRTVRNLFNRRGRFCYTTGVFWGYPVYFMMQSVIGQKFMQDHFGLSPDRAAVFTLILTLMSVVLCLAGVPVARRFPGNRRKPIVLLSAFALTISVAMMLAGVRYHLPAYVFYAAFAVIALDQFATAAMGFLMIEIQDPRTIAFGAAVRNCLPYVGAGAASCVSGLILNRFVKETTTDALGRSVDTYLDAGYEWVLVFAFVLSVLNLIVTFGIPETYGKRYYEYAEEEKAAA